MPTYVAMHILFQSIGNAKFYSYVLDDDFSGKPWENGL